MSPQASRNIFADIGDICSASEEERDFGREVERARERTRERERQGKKETGKERQGKRETVIEVKRVR